MLRPTKHTDPHRSVLAVSGLLLKHLRRRRIASMVELRDKLRAQDAANDVLFPPALTLLYALGLVEYRIKTDSLEFVGGENR